MSFTFDVDGQLHRVATVDQIKAARAIEGAPHVTFGCTQCGQGFWHAKNIAVSSTGGYTGARNIFYAGSEPECACPASFLRMIVPV